MTRFRGHLSFGTGGVHHAEKSPPYPSEFRAQMVELVHAGRKPEGQGPEIFKWNRRSVHAADLIAGSVAKYASSGVRSSRLA